MACVAGVRPVSLTVCSSDSPHDWGQPCVSALPRACDGHVQSQNFRSNRTSSSSLETYTRWWHREGESGVPSQGASTQHAFHFAAQNSLSLLSPVTGSQSQLPLDALRRAIRTAPYLFHVHHLLSTTRAGLCTMNRFTSQPRWRVRQPFASAVPAVLLLRTNFHKSPSLETIR